MSHARKVLDTLTLWVFSVLFDCAVLVLKRRKPAPAAPDEKRN